MRKNILFAKGHYIKTRGNVEVGFTAAAGLDEFDAILKEIKPILNVIYYGDTFIRNNNKKNGDSK